MKNTLLFLLITACLCSGVRAQSTSKLRFFAGSGTVLPISSDYYDNFSGTRNPGINVNAGVGYTFSPIFTLMTEFDYSRLNYDDNYFTGFQNEGGVEIFENSNLKNTLGFIGSLRISPLPNRRGAVPYLKIGAGAIRLTEVNGLVLRSQNGAQVESKATYSSWGPLLSAGGGFRFALSPNLSLITEINYMAWLDANGVSPVQFSPIKIGIEF